MYVNSKQSFIIFLDKFSKHVTCLPLTDRNSKTIVNVKKFVFDNGFNNENVKEFLRNDGIEYHATKPNSHTSSSDIERFNSTLTEKIRLLTIEEKITIIPQVYKAVTLYNDGYHSTVKCSPFAMQNNKIDHGTILNRLETQKTKNIERENKKRETYTEIRQIGFIKNYKNIRHKETPKYVKKRS